MSPYLPAVSAAKNGALNPMERAIPSPLRKRALSPSILDNETLTISSLIERTIERATTSTTTSAPMPVSNSVPFSSGVRPPQLAVVGTGAEDPAAALVTTGKQVRFHRLVWSID